MKSKRYLVGSSILGIATLLLVQPAIAQAAQSTAPEDTGLGEIVVTAQKREENINKVPMSITATSLSSWARSTASRQAAASAPTWPLMIGKP